MVAVFLRVVAQSCERSVVALHGMVEPLNVELSVMVGVVGAGLLASTLWKRRK